MTYFRKNILSAQSRYIGGAITLLLLFAFLAIFGTRAIAAESSVSAADDAEIYTQYRQDLRSLKRGAVIRIGGEVNVDYAFSLRDRGSRRDPSGIVSGGGWALNNTNLRFTIDLPNGAQGRIKLDLGNRLPHQGDQALLEEAMLIWREICGGPVGVFFGKGEVPYGQDRTLGIIQSYHHNDGAYSSEGQTILNGPLPGALFDGQNGNGAGEIWHPGEIDRVVMGGVTFDWLDILRFEAAVYQPDDYNRFYDERLPSNSRDSWFRQNDSGFDSFAARLWWRTPIEGLVAEISGLRKYDSRRDNVALFGEGARADSYAFSVGLDYCLPTVPLELFAEYERGINWNYRTDYDTHTLSIGALYGLTDRIEIGALAEWLRIDARGDLYDYNKFAAHTKYTFSNGIYLIGEYGIETLNWGSATAHLFAFRSGFSF